MAKGKLHVVGFGPGGKDDMTFRAARVIENADVDTEDWTDEKCEAEVRRVCETYGMKHFIPCIAQGGPGSVYPGVYMSLTKAIDKLNKEKFGIGDPDSARMPIQIMF